MGSFRCSSGLLCRTLLVIFAAIVLNSVADMLLSMGMKQVGPVGVSTPGDVYRIGVRMFTNVLFWWGIIGNILFYALYLVALSWAPVSFVTPLTAGSYILVVILSQYYLHEEVVALRWAGTLITTLGLYLIGRSLPPE